jgi:chaperonin GroES
MKEVDVTKVNPLAGYVLVKPQEQTKQTSSGIIIPDSHDEKPQNGKVLAVGEAYYDHGVKIEPNVKKGDKVFYKKWGGNEIKIGEIEYQFLKVEDILAVIK